MLSASFKLASLKYGLNLDFGDTSASVEVDFDIFPVPETGLENLSIKSLMLPARCRFELRDGPAEDFF